MGGSSGTDCIIRKPKGKYQSQNLDIDGKLTLKRILKQDRSVEWIHFAQNRNILAISYVQGCETSGSIKWKKRDLLTN
jgi:hypothetical protein